MADTHASTLRRGGRASDPGREPGQRRGISTRVLQRSQAAPGRPSRLTGSWWAFVGIACAACAVLSVAIWLSSQLHPDPTLHNVALFVHLASFALGFGAVLVADYFVILWLLRRSTFAEAVSGAARLHVPVWIGIIGLGLSGVLLHPNLAAGTTRLKLALVAVLVVNGVHISMILSKRLEASGGALGARLLAWGAVATTVSQAAWWGSMLIGFLTANKL